jgi:hypothetical protein
LGLVIEALRGQFPQLTREQFNREFSGPIDEAVDGVFARLPAFRDETREFFSNHKILCLSEVPDSIVMWAYYAQNHAGLVLRFCDAPGVDSPWSTARSIRYVKEMPNFFDDESLSNMLSGEAVDHRRIMDTFIFTKSTHWEHEREWRIYSAAGRTRESHEDIPFNAMELSGVIFGCRMPADERELVADLVRKRYPATTLFQATTRSDTYGLTIAPLAAEGSSMAPQVAKAIDLFAKGWNYDRAHAEAFWPQVHQSVRDYFLSVAAKSGHAATPPSPPKPR